MKHISIIALLVIVLIGLGAYAYTQQLVDLGGAQDGAPASADGAAAVKVPVFAEGGDIVCGVRMVYIERPIAPTKAVLDAAFTELFKMSEPYVAKGAQYQNPIGYQTTKTDFPKLVFERVTLANGVASVYLSGSITGVGTCYDPLPKIQMDATAKQFPTVTAVRYYLNGRETDPGCIADQSGLKPCYTGTERE